MPIETVLIANRGEIAVRVMRTARRMGYRTVAVFSSADRDAPHVRDADEAVWIGAAPASESYLAIEKILDAARRTGADALHPGYGFLSENADFAERVVREGLCFIGPPAGAIALMGNKRAAKIAMEQAGVPCVPGYDGADPSDAGFAKAAHAMGFPLMIKAAAGGGGRGMRLVLNEATLQEDLRAARAEARAAFGSSELILEKALVQARHVEVQVFADAAGGCIHLGERDCSVQRRHQKVLEESPSPAVDAALRDRLGACAVRAALACDYVGAGTVEFLLDPRGQFYFLEMNTRLQVEHRVTEAVTGLDLVEWQFRIADGESLPLQQPDVRLSGHAIEARLYAEDPSAGFVPQTGELHTWVLAEGPHVQVDSGAAAGLTVSPHYDPMIAKVVARGATRDLARRRLRAALRRTTVFGVVTNKALLIALLSDDRFVDGQATTSLIADRFGDSPLLRAGPPPFDVVADAALAVYLESGRRYSEEALLVGFYSAGAVWSTLRLRARGVTTAVEVRRTGRTALGQQYRVVQVADPRDPTRLTDGSAPGCMRDLVAADPGSLTWSTDGVQRTVRHRIAGNQVWVDGGDAPWMFEDVTHEPAAADAADGTGRLVAPLDGSVVTLTAGVGDRVAPGQVLVVVEAMKMEHPVRADVAGTVRNVSASVGTQVRARELLVEIAPNPEDA